MYKKIALIIITVGLTLQGIAQIDRSPFPKDSIKFFHRLEKMMGELTVGKKEGKKFIEEFRPIWYGGTFDDEIREVIYTTCDIMNEKHMLPMHEFKSYLLAIKAYEESEHDLSKFHEWHDAVEKKLHEKFERKFHDFILFSIDLFKYNSLYKTHVKEWKAVDATFDIYWDNESNQPVVKIDQFDLACISKGDSSYIYGTSGYFYPDHGIWKGTGGKVNWQRVGFEENEIIANLSDYEIKVKHSNYTANNVEFKNKNYFGESVLHGKLEEKVLANVNENYVTYPRFESSYHDLSIENIFPDVDYRGGFIQKGSKFIGKGTKEQAAKVIFNRNEKPFIEVRSHTFVIRESRIHSEFGEVYMYFNEDTIYHPGLTFVYENSTRILRLTRKQVGIGKAPFFNRLHDLEMFTEEIIWNIDGSVMQLGPTIGNSDKSALFESKDYYSDYRYDELYGLNKRHPLVILKKCAKEMGADELTLADISACWKLPSYQVERTIMVLSNIGFVKYNIDEQLVKVLPRTYEYVLARRKKSDYDILQLLSNPPERDDRVCKSSKSNAIFNIDSLYMQVYGVRGIHLSDSHNVTIYPSNCEVELEPNRNFNFSGVVVAGNLEFFGRNFEFEYDSFQIRMPIVDSMRINIETGEFDRNGNSKTKRVKTVIERINGKLEIDKFNNKSGKRAIKRWPVFISYGESYAYYDKPEIEGGIYKRDSFYFKLEPFTFDSLDNAKNSSIQFEGTFKSAGIFEDIKEALTLQPDYSLGFDYSTPEGGVPIYKNKGTFTADINLSNRGLKGNGFIDYLTSTAESNSFSFHLDSAFATAQQFTIGSQYPGPPEYPNTDGVNIDWSWYPPQDTLISISKQSPFSMYEKGPTFKGTLIYTPKILTGSGIGDEQGIFEFDAATVYSENIHFKFFEFFSDTSDFTLKTGSLGKLGFETKNMNADINFKTRKGEFKANSEEMSIIHFIRNEYNAHMDRFTWFMDEDRVDLSAKKRSVAQGADGDKDIEGVKLVDISKHSKSEEDSLYFYSKSCEFDIKNEIITAKEVPYVDVADSRITPSGNEIIILQKAKIQTLENAQIVANRENKFHKIYESTLDVINHVSFNGSGKRDYKDVEGNVSVIELSDIYVSKQLQTNAKGRIPESQNFYLNSRFAYHGDVSLESSTELLMFSGLARVEHSCKQLEKTWIQFSSRVDPNEVLIPIDTTTTNDIGKKIHIGQVMGTLPARVYSLFGSSLEKSSDNIISTVTGVIDYNYANKEFRVGSEQKVNIVNITGNYFTLNTEKCIVNFEGEHDWGADLGRVDMKPVSKLRHNLKNDSVSLKTTLLLDFFFEEKALKIMAKDIGESSNDRTDYDNSTYSYGLDTYLGEEQGKKLLLEVGLTGKMKKVPDEIAQLLYIANMKVIWDPEKFAFQNRGKIGVSNSYKNQINKEVKGTFEIKKLRSGDRFMMQIRKSRQEWYFFGYAAETMQIVSTNAKYNEAVKNAKKTKQEKEKGKKKFRFIPSSEAKAKQLLRNF